jgi:hypothetical protein
VPRFAAENATKTNQLEPFSIPQERERLQSIFRLRQMRRRADIGCRLSHHVDHHSSMARGSRR